MCTAVEKRFQNAGSRGTAIFFFLSCCSFSLAVWYIPYVCFVDGVMRGRTSSLSGRFLVLSLIQVYSPALFANGGISSS